MPERETEIVERHAEPGEHVRGTFCAYAWGIGRRVIGVTDQRFMLIKSRYWSVHGRRLLWADPIEKVALREHAPWFTYMTPTGGQRGNSYLHIRRASGRKPTVKLEAGLHWEAPRVIVGDSGVVIGLSLGA